MTTSAAVHSSSRSHGRSWVRPLGIGLAIHSRLDRSHRAASPVPAVTDPTRIGSRQFPNSTPPFPAVATDAARSPARSRSSHRPCAPEAQNPMLTRQSVPSPTRPDELGQHRDERPTSTGRRCPACSATGCKPTDQPSPNRAPRSRRRPAHIPPRSPRQPSPGPDEPPASTQPASPPTHRTTRHRPARSCRPNRHPQ